MLGLAFLVTFCAIAKSDWPRAAIERAGGRRQVPFSRPFDRLRANGEVAGNSLNFTSTLTPTLSRLRERGQSIVSDPLIEVFTNALLINALKNSLQDMPTVALVSRKGGMRQKHAGDQYCCVLCAGGCADYVG